MNSRVQVEVKTHHHVAVDILDDKITNILNSGISMIFIQRPGRAYTSLHWRPVDLGNQTWIIIIDIVRVAGAL